MAATWGSCWAAALRYGDTRPVTSAPHTSPLREKKLHVHMKPCRQLCVAPDSSSPKQGMTQVPAKGEWAHVRCTQTAECHRARSRSQQ